MATDTQRGADGGAGRGVTADRQWRPGDRVIVRGIVGTVRMRFADTWIIRVDKPQRVGERTYADEFFATDEEMQPCE